MEKELRKVRIVLNNSRPDNSEHSYCKKSSIPDEIIYADDTDFVSEDKRRRDILTKNIADILKEGNLKVNGDKTEQTIIQRGDKLTEHWRKVTKLGSLLGDQEDILRRKTPSTAAMNSMNKVWVRNKRISIEKWLKLYNLLVKPVLMYNSSTWGMTKKDMESLDAFHRKQLKKLWKINWKQKITNEQLYRMSKTIPLSKQIAKARWKLFGHVLRLNIETPAQKSIKYYFENNENQKKFRARPRTTIVTTLRKIFVKFMNWTENY